MRYLYILAFIILGVGSFFSGRIYENQILIHKEVPMLGLDYSSGEPKVTQFFCSPLDMDGDCGRQLKDIYSSIERYTLTKAQKDCNVYYQTQLNNRGTQSQQNYGATALCSDGTLSYSSNRSGTCSWHGGVAVWY